MTWRYIAQRITTGEFLDWEVPMSRDELTWQLSGSGSLRGSVTPDVGNLRASDGSLLLDEWGTALYAEKDGEIRWGGIVVRSNFNGPTWEVEAAGFATYPYGIPYLGDFRPGKVEPVRAIREIWRHVQSYPDADLGVVVTGPTSNVLLGTDEEPYALTWHEVKDCGSEIDTLSKEAPLDYIEECYWASDDSVQRVIRVGYPRHGRRRTDLAFVQGENITSVVTAKRDGADFSNEIVGLGAGEGEAMLNVRLAQRDGRLRRPYVYTDKAVTDTNRMRAISRGELAARAQTLEVSEITVIDHPHARIGSWALGDDITVRAEIPWLGEIEVLSRITSWSLVGEDRARLTLARSDSFRYGG